MKTKLDIVQKAKVMCAKDFMADVANAVQAVTKLQHWVEYQQSRIYGIRGMDMSGLPKAHCCSPDDKLVAGLAAVDNAFAELDTALVEYAEMSKMGIKAIYSLSDAGEREVLFMRYLELKKFDDICAEASDYICIATAYNRHERGLLHLYEYLPYEYFQRCNAYIKQLLAEEDERKAKKAA